MGQRNATRQKRGLRASQTDPLVVGREKERDEKSEEVVRAHILYYIYINKQTLREFFERERKRCRRPIAPPKPHRTRLRCDASRVSGRRARGRTNCSKRDTTNYRRKEDDIIIIVVAGKRIAPLW